VNVDRVNWLNVALMVVSCGLACLAPFTLFLIAFAVLGPLHYLTEISWLHDREYFSARQPIRRLWLAVVVAAMSAVTFGYVASEFFHRDVSPTLEMVLVALAFVVAGAAAFAVFRASAVAVMVVAVVVLASIAQSRNFAVAAYLLITIVHVLLFTGCFILFGALKSGRRSAYVSFAVFAVSIVATLFILPSRSLDVTIPASYSAFAQLNQVLLELFGYRGASLHSGVGRRVMQLIAFAYTYHYFNWFSKTSIIRWHEVSKKRGVVILLAWVISIALYKFDYRVGFSVLYVLSVMHVLLEFPLNHVAIHGLLRIPISLMGRSVRGGLTAARD